MALVMMMLIIIIIIVFVVVVVVVLFCFVVSILATACNGYTLFYSIHVILIVTLFRPLYCFERSFKSIKHRSIKTLY